MHKHSVTLQTIKRKVK